MRKTILVATICVMAMTMGGCSLSTVLMGRDVFTADDLGKKAVAAVYRGDKAGLAALGMTEEEAAGTIEKCKWRLTSPDATYAFVDGIVVRSYVREYVVEGMPKTGGERVGLMVGIKFTHRAGEELRVKGIIFPDPPAETEKAKKKS